MLKIHANNMKKIYSINMTMSKIKKGCLFLAMVTLIGETAFAQVSTLGLPPAASTGTSFVDASIVRDSQINQPLDLLNDFYPAVEVTIYDHDNVRRRSDIQEEDLKISVGGWRYNHPLILNS